VNPTSDPQAQVGPVDLPAAVAGRRAAAAGASTTLLSYYDDLLAEAIAVREFVTECAAAAEQERVAARKHANQGHPQAVVSSDDTRAMTLSDVHDRLRDLLGQPHPLATPGRAEAWATTVVTA
jgi:hypothetical protein